MSSRERAERIEALGPWFHNLHLPSGEQTAPNHPLGDFPSYKWRCLEPHLPRDMHGMRALDIGCNAGFYSFELARRGAHVTAIDSDTHYLRQAEWAARELDCADRVEFRQQSVYEIGRSDEQFDVILFMGVFYHLRHPLLALDILASKVRKLMVFQTLTMPGDHIREVPNDVPLLERDLLRSEGYPQMAFIEKRMAGDPTNWWAPNNAAVHAMLRSCGLSVVAEPGHEIYLCEPGNARDEVREELVRRELQALGFR